MKRSTLTEKLILYFLALGTASIITIGLFAYFPARRALINRTYDHLTSIRLARQVRVEAYFAERIREAAIIASSPDIQELFNSKPPWQALISFPFNDNQFRNILSSGNFSGIIISDLSGNIIFSHPDEPSIRIIADHKRPVPESHTLTHYISDYAVTDKGELIPLAVVCPITSQGQAEGTLIMPIKQTQIDNLLPRETPLGGLGYSGEVYLVGRDYLMRSQSRFIPNSIMVTTANTIPVQKAFSRVQGHERAMDYRKIEVLSSYNPLSIPGLDWVILAEIDYQEAISSINGIRNKIIIFGIFTALAFFILTYIISNRITRPLAKLKEAVVNMGEGRLDTALEVSARDEIGELTEAFNLMATNLHEKNQALRSERMNRLRSTIDGQDKERQRLSRELHDGIGQSLIAIRLKLALLENGISEKKQQHFHTLTNLTDNLIDEVRAISNALMPPSLAEFGLNAALRNLCNSISEAHGISVEISGELPGQVSGKKVKLYLFRIIQEALNNAVKHAGAQNITITSSIINDQLSLRIADDGSGFDPDSPCVSKGHGLNNIKERAGLLNGTAKISAAPGSGTVIQIDIPINKTP